MNYPDYQMTVENDGSVGQETPWGTCLIYLKFSGISKLIKTRTLMPKLEIFWNLSKIGQIGTVLFPPM